MFGNVGGGYKSGWIYFGLEYLNFWMKNNQLIHL